MCPHHLYSQAIPTLLRQLNEQRVLDTLIQHGPMSRADLTRRTGISAPTISKAVATLTDANFLEARDDYSNKTGRPAQRYALATESVQILGLTLTADECTLASSGLDCCIETTRLIHFQRPDTYDDLLALVAIHVKKLTAAHPGRTLSLCATVPTLLDPKHQPKLHCPDLPLLDQHTLATDLARRTRLNITVIQQAHALALAQRRIADPADRDNFVLVDLTAPLCVGAVVDGFLLRGWAGHAGALAQLQLSPDRAVAAAINLLNPRAVFLFDPRADVEKLNALIQRIRTHIPPAIDGTTRIAPADVQRPAAPLAACFNHLTQSPA